jgi:hypothetical protein
MEHFNANMSGWRGSGVNVYEHAWVACPLDAAFIPFGTFGRSPYIKPIF